MIHCEYKLAKASSEDELEKQVREAGREGWYRTSPNRTTGELPVESLHYCVLSRIQNPASRKAAWDSVQSFFSAKQSVFWRC